MQFHRKSAWSILEVGSVRLATTRFHDVAVADVPFPHRGWYVEATCTAFGWNRRGSNVWSGQIPFRLADLPPATQPSLILTADRAQKFALLSPRSPHLAGETRDLASKRISAGGCWPYWPSPTRVESRSRDPKTRFPRRSFFALIVTLKRLRSKSLSCHLFFNDRVKRWRRIRSFPAKAF